MFWFSWHWPKQRVVDLRGTGPWFIYLCGAGPNNVLSFHAALALASIGLCRIIQSGCSLCSFSVYVVFLFFQVILSSKSWKGFQNFSSLSVRQVLDVMFKSRADATAKTYIHVIKKFMDWCKSRQICMQLPFPLGVVSLYLLEVQQSCTSSSSVILAHAALKRLLKIHGRWKSDSAKDMYVQESLENRLQVTKYLGL